MTRQLLLVALVGLSLTSMARAQGDASGAIVGYVFDQAGNPLPGITITVRSPTQIGGPRKTTTNNEGYFRLPALFPGVFELRGRAQHMTDYIQQNIHVGLGTVEVSVFMAVATAGSGVVI